jgi:hypothetical protein
MEILEGFGNLEDFLRCDIRLEFGLDWLSASDGGASHAVDWLSVSSGAAGHAVASTLLPTKCIVNIKRPAHCSSAHDMLMLYLENNTN